MLDLGKPILFATSKYDYLKKQLLASGRFEDGVVARSQDKDGTPRLEDVPFPDGERYHRLLTDVDDREVVLIGGCVDDRETMELFDLGTALVMNGAVRLKLIIPYLAYSTMERAIYAGEVVKLKARAILLSSIPRAALGNKMYLCDLHAEGTPSFFEGGLFPKHIYAKRLIIDSIAAAAEEWQRAQKIKLPEPEVEPEGNLKLKVRKITCTSPDVDAVLADDFVLTDFTVASTDAGRAKWVESLCRDMLKRKLPVHPAFIIKRRVSGTETEIADISAEVEGKLVCIYDDMIRTGGSAISAAKAYLKKKALAVILVSTHGVLHGNSLQRLKDSGAIHKVIVTDTHPRAHELADDFLQVVQTGDMFIENIFNGKNKLGV